MSTTTTTRYTVTIEHLDHDGDTYRPASLVSVEWARHRGHARVIVDSHLERIAGRRNPGCSQQGNVWTISDPAGVPWSCFRITIDVAAQDTGAVHGPDDRPTRYAEIRGASGIHDLDTVNAYMPSNYRATLRADMMSIVIIGVDVAGWTLDDYVIPRLASGLIFAKEISADEVAK